MNIPYLEIPITHRCNLRCDGCSAYANYSLKDEVSRDDLWEWVNVWKTRITPEFVRILGGEPFLHHELLPIIIDIRNTWPKSTIEVCSNGLIIEKHKIIDDIWKWMKKLNIRLHISIHADTKKYQDKISPVIDYLEETYKKYNIPMTYGDNVKNWSRFYKGDGVNIEPFEDDNIFASYNKCHMAYCVNLVNNKLWKCPARGNLEKLKNKIKLSNKWDKYLAFDGLSHNCSEDEIKFFFIQTALDLCGMCPSNPVQYKKEIGL